MSNNGIMKKGYYHNHISSIWAIGMDRKAKYGLTFQNIFWNVVAGNRRVRLCSLRLTGSL